MVPQVLCEVRAEMARERTEEFARFYVELLGLSRWPEVAQIPGGWGVGPLRRGLFFHHRHDPIVDPVRRRVSLVTVRLEDVEARLAAAGWPYERQRGVFSTEDCLIVADPCGNRVEVRQTRRF